MTGRSALKCADERCQRSGSENRIRFPIQSWALAIEHDLTVRCNDESCLDSELMGYHGHIKLAYYQIEMTFT